MVWADLLGPVVVAALGGIGVWFSLALKRHNDLTAERDQSEAERDQARAERERRQAYEMDRDRFEAVSGEVGLRLLRALNAGMALPPLTTLLLEPPRTPEFAGDVPQFAATWVYDNEAVDANPRARTFDTHVNTAVEAIEVALYSSGGHHLLADGDWLDRVLLGNPRTKGPRDGVPGGDKYVRASDVPLHERAAYSFAMFYSEECVVWVYRITGDGTDEPSR